MKAKVVFRATFTENSVEELERHPFDRLQKGLFTHTVVDSRGATSVDTNKIKTVTFKRI